MSRNVAVTATQYRAIGRAIVAYFTTQSAVGDWVKGQQIAAERKLTLSLAKQYRKLAARADKLDSDLPFREASAYIVPCWRANGGNVGTCRKMLSHLKALATADKDTPEGRTFAAYCRGKYPVTLQEAYKTRKTRKAPAKPVSFGREVRGAWGMFLKVCRAHKLDPRKVALTLSK